MLRKLLHVSVISAAVAALAACGGQTGAGDGVPNGTRANSVDAGFRAMTDSTQHAQLGRVARAIERIDGVSRANVVMANSNAYVTVELDNQAPNGQRLGGNNARSSKSARGFGMKGNYYGPTDSRIFPTVPGWDNDRLRREETARSQRNGVTGARGDTPRNNGFSTNQDVTDMYGYGTSGRPSSRMNGTSGTGRRIHSGENSGNGMISGITMNGTNGSILDRGSRANGSQNGSRSMDSSLTNAGTGVNSVSVLNADVRGEIESIVRTMVHNVRNVYVSTNLDFMDDLAPKGPVDNSFDIDNPRHRTGMSLR